MQQCREGWHLDQEPERQAADGHREEPARGAGRCAGRCGGSGRPGAVRTSQTCPGSRSSSGRSGKAFTSPSGRDYRPSMFLTLTLDSYGPVTAGGDAADRALRLPPRRAGRDALPEARRPVLAEPATSRRLPGAVLRGGRGAAPAGATPARRDPRRDPAGDRAGGGGRDVPPGLVAAASTRSCTTRCSRSGRKASGYVDPTSREPLPTWDEALDALEADEDADAGARGAVRRARSTCRGSSPRRTTPIVGWPT